MQYRGRNVIWRDSLFPPGKTEGRIAASLRLAAPGLVTQKAPKKQCRSSRTCLHRLLRPALQPSGLLALRIPSTFYTNKKPGVFSWFFVGTEGGIRTRKPFGQRILSPSCIPFHHLGKVLINFLPTDYTIILIIRLDFARHSSICSLYLK